MSKVSERIRDFDKPFDSSTINIFAPVYLVVLRLWSNCNINKMLSKSISISIFALELLRNSSKLHDFTVQSDSQCSAWTPLSYTQIFRINRCFTMRAHIFFICKYKIRFYNNFKGIALFL